MINLMSSIIIVFFDELNSRVTSEVITLIPMLINFPFFFCTFVLYMYVNVQKTHS